MMNERTRRSLKKIDEIVGKSRESLISLNALSREIEIRVQSLGRLMNKKKSH